jgi:hypothetical protein
MGFTGDIEKESSEVDFACHDSTPEGQSTMLYRRPLTLDTSGTAIHWVWIMGSPEPGRLY